MAPGEFVLFLVGVLAFGIFMAAIISAQSNDPIRVLAMTLATSIIMVIAVALIGIICYVIAWAWRNPLIVLAAVVCGLLAELLFSKPKFVT